MRTDSTLSTQLGVPRPRIRDAVDLGIDARDSCAGQGASARPTCQFAVSSSAAPSKNGAPGNRKGAAADVKYPNRPEANESGAKIAVRLAIDVSAPCNRPRSPGSTLAARTLC